MRESFAKKLTQLASADKRIVLLSGDIGNRMFDDFKKAAPGRFVNCGIAEANMMSVASGLSLEGFRPVVYTIAPFTTARCYEQIRIGIAYHEAPVLIVGTGAGLTYGPLGTTHHALDDIALFTAIGKNIDVYTPIDPLQTANQLDYFFSQKRPAYMRLGKKGEPIITQDRSGYASLQAEKLRDGVETVVITMGPLAKEMVDACELAKKEDDTKNASVVALGSIEPFDETFFREVIGNNYSNWIVVEEHGESGGLSDRIRRLKYNTNQFNEVTVHFCNTGGSILFDIGSQNYLRQKCNIDKKAIMELILKL